MMQPARTGAGVDRASGSRLLPLSGVAFALILLVGIFSSPTPPQPADTVETIRAYYVQHATGVRIYVFASAVAAALLLVFVATLRRALSEAETAAAVTYGAGVLTLAATLASTAGLATLAQGTISEPGVVRAIFDLSNMALNAGDFMLALLVGVPATVALRTGFLPKWLACAGLVLSGAWTLAGASIVVRSGAFAGPNGPYGLFVAIAFIGWVVCVSLVTYRRWEPDA